MSWAGSTEQRDPWHRSVPTTCYAESSPVGVAPALVAIGRLLRKCFELTDRLVTRIMIVLAGLTSGLWAQEEEAVPELDVGRTTTTA